MGFAYIFRFCRDAVDGLETFVLDVLLKVDTEGVKPILDARQESEHPREVYSIVRG